MVPTPPECAAAFSEADTSACGLDIPKLEKLSGCRMIHIEPEVRNALTAVRSMKTARWGKPKPSHPYRIVIKEQDNKEATRVAKLREYNNL